MTDRSEEEIANDPAQEEVSELPKEIGADVPEADALEQARPWSGAGKNPDPKIPMDVPEADALEQAREAWDEDDEER